MTEIIYIGFEKGFILMLSVGFTGYMIGLLFSLLDNFRRG